MNAAQLICIKWLLGPVLLSQGLWVRYKTPQLPEPAMARTGTCGKGQPLRLLLLGDSSAAGVGAESAEASLLGQLQFQLGSNFQLHFHMLAKTGRTTADTLAVVKQQTAQPFDVIITALGVNDVTAQVSLTQWQNQQAELIELLNQQYQPQLIIMSGLPPVRDFPALPWPLSWYLGGCADRLNQCLQEICEGQRQVIFHSLRHYPEEVKAAADGFHPGPQVYRLWAQYLAALIESKLIHQ